MTVCGITMFLKLVSVAKDVVIARQFGKSDGLDAFPYYYQTEKSLPMQKHFRPHHHFREQAFDH